MQSLKAFVLLLLFAAPPLMAAHVMPLRVDLNTENRADMRTPGWENWRPAETGGSQTFGQLKVTFDRQR